MYPHFDYVEDKWLARKVFKKLSLRYILAISCIAIMIIANQVVARKLMVRQLDDSKIINVAGRQRMLSQKLTKELLLLNYESNSNKQIEILKGIDSTYTLWKQSHLGLQNGNPAIGLPGQNSDEIKQLFQTIQTHFDIISENYLNIKADYNNSPSTAPLKTRELLDQILLHEPSFLIGMDNIVDQYDIEAKERVSSLIRLESTLLFIALIVLLFEVLFIFWPTAVYTKSIVTELIDSEERQKQLQEKAISKKSEEQKILTTMFFEGQERERRRIVRDLHDGIGQLLTGLKFKIEAIDMDDPESMVFQVGEIKGFAGDIIKEIRRVSFDLRPSVLSDFGLTSAIRKVTQELNKLTTTEVSFNNKTDFNMRFEKKLETHIFRIIQEALNNALKYAKAKKILVEFSHNNEFLTATIKDNGIGFNLDNVKREDYEHRKGHGLFNMLERSGFINAEFTIDTKPEKGTIIKLIVPLPKQNV